MGEAGSASIISKEEIEEIGATHANEVLARVPGVWVNRGSGQEHLTAIRSAFIRDPERVVSLVFGRWHSNTASRFLQRE